jgi:hypothetical protein
MSKHELEIIRKRQDEKIGCYIQYKKKYEINIVNLILYSNVLEVYSLYSKSSLEDIYFSQNRTLSPDELQFESSRTFEVFKRSQEH